MMTRKQILKWQACLVSVMSCIMGVGFLVILERYKEMDPPTFVLMGMFFVANLILTALLNRLVAKDY